MSLSVLFSIGFVVFLVELDISKIHIVEQILSRDNTLELSVLRVNDKHVPALVEPELQQAFREDVSREHSGRVRHQVRAQVNQLVRELVADVAVFLGDRHVERPEVPREQLPVEDHALRHRRELHIEMFGGTHVLSRLLLPVHPSKLLREGCRVRF
jgi:hypothetical protein